MAYSGVKIQSRFYPGDFVTRTGDQGIRSASGRLPDYLGELACMLFTQSVALQTLLITSFSVSSSSVCCSFSIRLRGMYRGIGVFSHAHLDAEFSIHETTSGEDVLVFVKKFRSICFDLADVVVST